MNADNRETGGEPTAIERENARLRLAVAHLVVYSRAVLECRDNGGITIAHCGHPTYEANAAFIALEECVSRAVSGDWRIVTSQQIDAIWATHARNPLFGERYLTRDGFAAAVNTLLWHPERLGGHSMPAASARTA